MCSTNKIKCIECGSCNRVYSKAFGIPLCCNCTVMYKKHPINPLPSLGVVEYDDQGRVICHICGRAYEKLSNHIIYRHKLTVKEYKKKFELNDCTGLASDLVKQKLRDKVKQNYDSVVKENLISNGKNTRYKKGCRGRTKDKVRLEMILNMRKGIE